MSEFARDLKRIVARALVAESAKKCDIGMLPSAELTELWSVDQIIKGQESDPAICLLKSWLNAGKKPIPHEIEFDITISCYYEQFASFVIIENIVYRKFFATNALA